MPPGKRPRLVLGTAQLGMPYGAANRTGMLSDNEAVAILHAAVDAGVTCVDTARGYGESERRIGLAFRGLKGAPAVVTKVASTTSSFAIRRSTLPCSNIGSTLS